ncbi:MAG: hypothetical protein C0468_05480 [Planctomyces sp.]|nr:hypothetical protein [Planctomyces sp.]MBA4120792.1 hypothetical protein [Isosphaera sp.]
MAFSSPISGSLGSLAPGGLRSIEAGPEPLTPARSGQGRARAGSVDTQGQPRGVDSVELSSESRRLAQTTPARDELVRSVRAAIESDTYVTQDKIDIAAERLLADLTR